MQNFKGVWVRKTTLEKLAIGSVLSHPSGLEQELSCTLVRFGCCCKGKKVFFTGACVFYVALCSLRYLTEYCQYLDGF